MRAFLRAQRKKKRKYDMRLLCQALIPHGRVKHGYRVLKRMPLQEAATVRVGYTYMRKHFGHVGFHRYAKNKSIPQKSRLTVP